MNFILFALLVSVGINLVMFIPAYLYKTDKITDISYAVTFAVVAVAGYSRSDQSALHKLVLVLVLLWSVRLGGFLFMRIQKIGKDVRFDGMREHFWLFLRFWLLQGLTVFVVMLGPILALSQKDTTFHLVTLLGIIIFGAGLIIEAVADMQKFRFGSNPKNKGAWIDTGIWRTSRHPNYLGEMMVWIGMYFVVVTSLSGYGAYVALLSPAYIVGLLLFVSGVPLLEKSADKKWGTDASYISYKQRVPTVLPTNRSVRRLFK